MSEWISVSDRLPTEKDGDVYGCVEAWHMYQGNMITGWHQIGKNSFFTHWKRVTPPPEK